MDSRNGYIKLYRQLLGSQVFANEGLLKVWVYCLLKASHKEQWVTIKTGRGETEIKVGVGQFIFGRDVAAKELGMKPSSVRNRMQKLEKVGNLDIEVDTHYSVVTVCNWDNYQSCDDGGGQVSGQPSDRQVTGKGQAKDTYKKSSVSLDSNIKLTKVDKAKIFYDEQLALSNNDPNYKTFIDFLFGVVGSNETLDSVLSIPKQMTYLKFQEIFIRYKKANVKLSEMLLELDNYKGVKNYKTLSTVLSNWLERRIKGIKK